MYRLTVTDPEKLAVHLFVSHASALFTQFFAAQVIYTALFLL